MNEGGPALGGSRRNIPKECRNVGSIVIGSDILFKLHDIPKE